MKMFYTCGPNEAMVVSGKKKKKKSINLTIFSALLVDELSDLICPLLPPNKI